MRDCYTAFKVDWLGEIHLSEGIVVYSVVAKPAGASWPKTLSGDKDAGSAPGLLVEICAWAKRLGQDAP